MNKKALIEKKNSLLDEMEQLLEVAATETRALSSDEEKVYNEKKDEVSRLSTTIAEIEAAERRSAEKGEAAERRPDRKGRAGRRARVLPILFSDARVSFAPVSRTSRWATTRLLSRPRSPIA